MRARARIARICRAESALTGGTVSTSNSRIVCWSSTPMRLSPRAVSFISVRIRLFFIGHFHQFSFDNRVCKLRGRHREQRAGQFLQSREFPIIDVGLLVLTETVE